MKRIAALCAYNRRNCGMYSVDLTAQEFFARHGMECDLWLTQSRRKTGGLKFRALRSASDLAGYDAVVFWGDFQNNPMWGANDYARRQVRRGGARNLEEAFETWKRFHLSLKSRLPPGVATYAFGGCFMGMEPYLDDPETRHDVERFFRDTDGVIVRDTLSHQIIARSLGPAVASKVQLGFDVASLLRLAAAPRRRAGRYFVHDFGRSGIENEARSLTRRLESELGIESVSLGWLEPGRGGVTHRRFTRKLALISGAVFAVTDIYHLAINCFRTGTLPIGLTRANAVPDGTLSDVKKEVLYDMLDCRDLLLEVSQDGDAFEIRDALLSKAAAVAGAASRSGERFRAFERRRDELETRILEVLSRTGVTPGTEEAGTRGAARERTGRT